MRGPDGETVANANVYFIIVGDRVQSMHSAETVLEVNTRKALGAMGVKGAVFAGKYDGDMNQKWTIDYV